MNKDRDILVVDDEQVVIDAVTKICSAEGFTVDSANGAVIGINKIEKNSYKLIICDIMMPVIDGFGFLEELHKRKITSPVIMTTGFSTVENAVKSLYTGAIDFIPKPFTADEILNAVFRAVKYIEIQNNISKFLNGQSDVSIIYVPCPAKYYRLGYSSWVVEENTGSMLIGVTDLFLKTIDNVTGIELSRRDDEIVQGNACGQITDKEGRVHPLLSPVSGRIIEVNEEIKINNSIIEKDPYFKGWFYRIIPSDSEYELKSLTNCSSDRL
ncbi:MAG: response regulator [Ignavibacteriaceae bacterium]